MIRNALIKYQKHIILYNFRSPRFVHSSLNNMRWLFIRMAASFFRNQIVCQADRTKKQPKNDKIIVENLFESILEFSLTATNPPKFIAHLHLYSTMKTLHIYKWRNCIIFIFDVFHMHTSSSASTETHRTPQPHAQPVSVFLCAIYIQICVWRTSMLVGIGGTVFPAFCRSCHHVASFFFRSLFVCWSLPNR